jgi:hypothetical protein
LGAAAFPRQGSRAAPERSDPRDHDRRARYGHRRDRIPPRDASIRPTCPSRGRSCRGPATARFSRTTRQTCAPVQPWRGLRARSTHPRADEPLSASAECARAAGSSLCTGGAPLGPRTRAPAQAAGTARRDHHPPAVPSSTSSSSSPAPAAQRLAAWPAKPPPRRARDPPRAPRRRGLPAIYVDRRENK